MVDLLRVAVTDLNKILSIDFAQDIEFISPAGVSLPIIRGYCNQVALSFDPETGQNFAASRASVSIPKEAIVNLQIELPNKSEVNGDQPWIVSFTDKLNIKRTYSIIECMPDDTLQCVVYKLGLIKT